MLVCTVGGERGGGRKTCSLYTHENVEFFGWTLIIIVIPETGSVSD